MASLPIPRPLLLVIAAVGLGSPAAAQTPPAPAPVPLPVWFHEIDTAKKGEVSRADFVKYRMRAFDQLDANKDGKLTLEEYLKIAEPPFNSDKSGTLEDRRARARAEFQTLDINGDGVIERTEAEVPFNAEFNQYDTDRDNKITEPELRLIVLNSMRREEQARREAEARNRAGKMTVGEYIDIQLREADKLDTNQDGRISAAEYQTLAGPADGAPQSQNLPPFEVRRKLVMLRFNEIDTNKDGVLDRVELTAYAVGQFLDMDLNKDRFLTEDEFRKAQEAEAAKMKTLLPTLMPAAPQKGPAPAPAPAPPQGPKPGLPQNTPR